MRGFLLPACRECNGLAGTDYPYNFSARAALVKSKLRNKYSRLINTPEWSQDEIRELGRNLKTSVKGWANKRTVVMRRLAWNPIAYIAGIGGKEFLALDSETNATPGDERESFRKQLKRIYDGLGVAA